MSLFHGYNEIPKSDNLMAMSNVPSPCKTTVFKPKESNQKSKGLSIRSNSDMNVFHSTRPTNVKERRETYSQVLEKTQWKYSNCEYRNVEFEGLTPKGEKGIIDKNKKTERILDSKIFKKPLLPKRFLKPVREPEHLAHFYDAQHRFDHEYIENIEQGFMNQFLKGKENVISCEERDSEMLLSVEIPKCVVPSSFDEDYIEISSPELPCIFNDDTL